MFNFVYALLNVVSDGFQSTGTSATVGGIEWEAILILAIVFIAGMYTQYAFTKIKEYIKERKANKKDNDKRE